LQKENVYLKGQAYPDN